MLRFLLQSRWRSQRIVSWLHNRSSCKLLEKVLEKRYEVKQTGHIGFYASDAKELKILNRTIKNRCAE